MNNADKYSFKEFAKIAVGSTAASKLLGVTRPTLHALIKKYKIDVARFSPKFWLIRYDDLKQLLELKIKETKEQDLKDAANKESNENTTTKTDSVGPTP